MLTLLSGAGLLAPFRVRSFRFQWPADPLTSWGSLYCAIGVTLTGVIALRWRSALWPLDAPASAR
jgi:hypothetical protein